MGKNAERKQLTTSLIFLDPHFEFHPDIDEPLFLFSNKLFSVTDWQYISVIYLALPRHN